MRNLSLIVILLVPGFACAQAGFRWEEDAPKRKIILKYGDQPVTAYCYFDSTEKPILYPLTTLDGVVVTRGYPVAPRPGERTDHPHHAGLWFNYESVNGLDFWNNSDAIPSSRKHRYGSIRHIQVLGKNAAEDQASLSTLSHWVDSAGNVLLEEITEFRFRAENNALVIDRAARLLARAPRVEFRDVKDGMLAIRVARELEMPSSQEDIFVDSQGNPTTVAKKDNTGVTGMYRSREGRKGDEVWGTRSRWVVLSGRKNNRDISIGIIDHPTNPGFPAYWHARGYGLFAVNPLGQYIFSNGKERLDLTLLKGESVTFQYRVVIAGNEISDARMDELMTSFAGKGN